MPRTPEEIATELEEARLSLAAQVDALGEHVKPSNVLRRKKLHIKRALSTTSGKPDPKIFGAALIIVGLVIAYNVRRRV